MSWSASGGSSLFASTGRWRAGVATLSQVDRKRLPVMLNRIAKAVGTGSTPFKPAELVQLEGLLGLSGDQLSLVVDTASYIFNQAAYAQSTVPYVSSSSFFSHVLFSFSILIFFLSLKVHFENI